ncbi:MAG: CHAD domain-containing protein [Deltaproteobacteria bacterium]|nr:CHAD domain-containing protein [Deltaproteobacteria bacterium]
MTTQPAATEIEYKYHLPDPEAGSAAVNLLRSKGYRVSERRTVHQEDLYLDTFDWRLFKSGLSLRLRRANGKTFFTLKSLGKIEGGRAQRREIEVEVPGDIGDPAALKTKEIRQEVAGIIHPRKLIGQLAVRTERRPYLVICPEGTQVELAFDTTGFSSRGLNRPRNARRLYEMEAELKKGEPAGLENMQLNLAGQFGLVPSRQSKLETAIERLDIRFPSKNPPPQWEVRRDDRLDRAVQKILSFQLRRFEENVPGVLQDIDTEFVHQARVATRRMRSLIRLFSSAIPEKTASYLADELFWLGSLFGGVRDLDVFLLNVPSFAGAIRIAPRRSIAALREQIEDEREVRLEELKAGLASARCRLFLSRLRAFAERALPKNPSAPLALALVQNVAPHVITQRFDAVIAQGRKVLDKPKLKNFHKLRIQFKRLRYASEFVSPAYGDALEAFIAQMVKIQDCLGELQDTVFTRSLIEGLLRAWKGRVLDPGLLFMLGEIYELQCEIARQRQAEFKDAWKRFDQEATRTAFDAALKSA